MLYSRVLCVVLFYMRVCVWVCSCIQVLLSVVVLNACVCAWVFMLYSHVFMCCVCGVVFICMRVRVGIYAVFAYFYDVVLKCLACA